MTSGIHLCQPAKELRSDLLYGRLIETATSADEARRLRAEADEVLGRFDPTPQVVTDAAAAAEPLALS